MGIVLCGPFVDRYCPCGLAAQNAEPRRKLSSNVGLYVTI
jgi:hypothetical protein